MALTYVSRSTTTSWLRWRVVFGGFLFNLTTGTIYTFANLNLYFASYFRKMGQTSRLSLWGAVDKGMDDMHDIDDLIRTKDLSLCYALAVAGIGLMVFFGGKLEKSIGPRGAALVGGWMMSAGVIASSWTIQYYPLFLLTYGLIFGIASGIAYPCPLVCAFKWLPDSRGIAGGIILAGTGLSPLIFGPLQTFFVNPQNVLPTGQPYPSTNPEEVYYEDEAVLARVPNLLFWSGCIYAVIQLIGALTFVTPPAEIYEERCRPAQVLTPLLTRVNYAPSEIVTMRPFWVLWVLFFFNGQVVSFMATFWKIVGQAQLGLSDKSMAIVGNSVIAIASAIGRIFWGLASDNYPFRTCMLALTVLSGIFAGSLNTASQCGPVVYFLWLSVLYFCIGGSFSLFPAVTSKAFGQVHFGPNYGVMYTARVASSIVQAMLLSAFYHKVGNAIVMPALAVCCLFSVALSLVYDAPKTPRGIL